MRLHSAVLGRWRLQPLSLHFLVTFSCKCYPSSAFSPGYGRLFQPFRHVVLLPKWFAADARQTPEEAQMTEDCKAIYKAAINAVDPSNAVKRHLIHVSQSEFRIGSDGTSKTVNLDDYNDLAIVAFGKASSAMATAVLETFLKATTLPKISGLVIVKDEHATADEISLLKQHNIVVREAAHPIPDQRSVDASNELLNLVQSLASERTLVIACISGGGSALFCSPLPPLTLEDLQKTNAALLSSGWGIQDMNVIRKRLERGKGGRLAEAAYPGTVVSFILSDVLGDPLDLIASGPTVPDTSTWHDAWKLVQQLPEQSLPQPVMNLLERGVKGMERDSPSGDHPAFTQPSHVLVGNNALAVAAAAKQADSLGYHSVILGTQIEGEAKEVAKVMVGLAQHLQTPTHANYSMARLPAALIVGGETTVSLPKDSSGKGGRNQELALAGALALKLAGLRQIVLASVGTDGSDGPTDAAGAVVDGGTIDRLQGNAMEALVRHDAYPFLSQVDEAGVSPLQKTGPTGTNVADVCVILVKSQHGTRAR